MRMTYLDQESHPSSFGALKSKSGRRDESCCDHNSALRDGDGAWIADQIIEKQLEKTY